VTRPHYFAAALIITLPVLATPGGNPVTPINAAARMQTIAALYDGPAATGWESLEAYSGKQAADRIVGEDRRAAYLYNYRQLDINYGGGVEFQLRARQAILCPQTAEFLYSEFTPTTVRYQKGSRPRLEAVAAEATAGCASQADKALAIMRLCRDLYKQGPKTPWNQYVFGGTEEEMLDKPEILCETLGRLMVALCEVIGVPGRVVMHDIGGHIGAEIFIDGDWAYIDPRCGMYFRKPKGGFASVWELVQDPSIIWQQTDAVKADVSDQWSWGYRAWKCASMYFTVEEVNGFQNYSLADADSYDYKQVPYKDAEAAGLMDVNADYVKTAQRVFGVAGDGRQLDWSKQPLRKIDIAYRNDGFSHFFCKPTMTRETLQRDHVNILRDTNAGILVWGLGPGSVFCYETKVGQIFGEGLSEQQMGLLREGDRWVHENVMNLIEEGPGPLAMAIEAAHEAGIKILARLEMNHEYGPAKDDNWMWVAFVGDLNKKHPEYRIGKGVLLDFKHKEVRDFKLAILREAAEAGADGVSLDLVVYPPFFEKADPAIMTGFVRDVRTMLEEVGRRQNRSLELMARVPFVDYMELGLDWKTWLREGLVDIIVPTHRRPADYFDIRVEEFIAVGRETDTKVYPTLWQALGFVTTDQHPSDEKTGRRRYDKPKTQGMYYAQAMLFHRAGADGVQLGMSENQWKSRPYFDDLADPEKVLYADKHYMVDPIEIRPGTFELEDEGHVLVGERKVGLRIGDDVFAAKQAGYNVEATMVVYCRPLQEGERLSIYVNGNDPVEISGDAEDEKTRAGVKAIDPRRQRHDTFLFERNWWKRGEHKLAVDPDWWKLQDNEIELVYSTKSGDMTPPLSITWIDLLLDYDR